DETAPPVPVSAALLPPEKEAGEDATAAPEPEVTAHLPPQFTRFFGREPELARLQEMLQQAGETPSSKYLADADRGLAVRLVTLTGPGGAGKTRLAIEAAARMAAQMPGGVWFVPLAERTDAHLLFDAILDAMHLPPAPGREALSQVVERLAGQPSLLVLDNFEQLVAEGAARVRKLLEQAPLLRCLITSRFLLNVEGEQEFVVPPLPLPLGEVDPERLAQCESARLFVDRAQMVKPDFQVTAHNAAALAELCRRLEGLPLALELAAGRAQALTPTQMLAQLERRLDFLVSRRRDTTERHRTLRGAIDWSFRLLSPELQSFFVRLSVFRGGWSLAAAEAVCEEPLALDYLAQLRECSLVIIEDDTAGASEMRFRLLEMLRAYAVEQVCETEQAALARRHAAYYRQMAEAAEPTLRGPHQGEWLARLAADQDNLRAALDWLHTQGEEEPAARMCVALAVFWEKRGWLQEGRQRLMRCLERHQEMPDSGLVIRLLGALGWFADLQGDYEEASAHHERSLLLCRQVGDTEGEAVALNNLALVAQMQGHLPEARRLFEQSLLIARRLGDGPPVAARLSNLGLLATQEGQYEEARRCLTEAHTIYRRCGATSGTIACLCNLGDLALRRQEWNEAEMFLKEGLALSRQVEDLPGTAYILANLAEVTTARADPAAAEQHLREALSICLELDMRSLVPSLLEIHAGVQQARRADREAAFSLACAESLRSELRTPRSAEEEARLSALEATLRTQIPPKEIEAIRILAAGLSLEEIAVKAMPGDTVAT
ncbi:MAG TPA: tetratricopeptide repeat protein, partial [Chthonomonadaceae bacterium]|nr:tetratricopeptide repeat protein [Chthonomonadaceae bacterium]